MIDRNAVLPAAWNALVNALCKEAPHLQNTLAPDVARFSRTKATPGGLSAAFTTSLLGYNGSPLEFTVSSAKPQGLACTLDPFYRAMRSAAAPAPLSDTVRRSPRPRSPIPLTAWRRCDVCNVQAFSRCASAPGWGENTPRTRSKPRSTLKPPRTWRPHPMACKGRSPPRPAARRIDAADGGVLPGICRLSARILLPVAQCADHA